MHLANPYPTSEHAASQHAASIRPLPRASLPALLGPLHAGPEIIDGLCATRLAKLPAGGTLYLSAQGRLLAVHATADPQLMQVQEFTGTPEAVWAQVAARYPDVRPGSPALPRFHLVLEPTVPGFPPTLGLLDLLTMQVIERDASRERLLVQQAFANRQPEHYLRGVQRAERAAAVEDALRHLPGVHHHLAWAA